MINITTADFVIPALVGQLLAYFLTSRTAAASDVKRMMCDFENDNNVAEASVVGSSEALLPLPPEQPPEDPLSSTTSSSPCQEFYQCVIKNNCSSSTILLALLLASLLLVVVLNIIAWYKFVVAWNLISHTHKVDMAFILSRCPSFDGSSQRTRKIRHHIESYLRRIRPVHLEKEMNKQTTCPICLVDFYEQECVTSCYDNGGCGTWFHTQCLYEWLDRSDSCPCCRKDLVPPRSYRDDNNNNNDSILSQRGWISDFSIFLGYSPH